MENRLIDIPHIDDERGCLSYLEESNKLPFKLKRAYWIYNVKEGETRGKHAHRRMQQVLIALSGSFTVILDDGKKKETFKLDNPSKGLLVTPGTWRELHSFSPDAVCLALVSEIFQEDDYIKDYDEFLAFKNEGSKD